MLHFFVLAAALAASESASAVPPAAPCYGTWPYGADFETMCFSIVQTDGNITVRDYATAGIASGPVIASSPSTYTNFSAGSYQATGYTIDYFLYNNDRVEKIPLTTPLIFRPTRAGTWAAKFALPPSKISTKAQAPQPTNPVTYIELFSNKRVASYSFFSDELATEEQYSAACAQLSTWLQGQGLTPVPGEWAVAWVTYSDAGQVGDRYNECWAEIASP